MVRILSILVCFLFAAAAAAQSTKVKFGFQELLLDMPLAEVPARYKGDCGQARDPKFVFCYALVDAGTVPMSIVVSFTDQRLSEIHAYFPVAEFDVVWLALREKYGKESSRVGGEVQWLSSQRELGQPIPDQLTLRREPKKQPTPDGKYVLPSVRYSEIEYESLWIANEAMRRKQEEHDQKVKGVANKL